MSIAYNNGYYKDPLTGMYQFDNPAVSKLGVSTTRQYSQADLDKMGVELPGEVQLPATSLAVVGTSPGVQEWVSNADGKTFTVIENGTAKQVDAAGNPITTQPGSGMTGYEMGKLGLGAAGVGLAAYSEFGPNGQQDFRKAQIGALKENTQLAKNQYQDRVNARKSLASAFA